VLPRPVGLYVVGSITHELVDANRTTHLASEALGRRLLLKIWYPAATATTRPELLWTEVRRDARTPLPIRLLLACVRVRSAAIRGAAMNPALRASPLVLYNHGLISFRAENTSLMEDLASHGYTVLAIEHADQLAERQALTRGGDAGKQRARKALERQLAGASAQERARLAPEYYDGAASTNRIVIERSADTSFVMDNASSVVAAIPGLRPDSVDMSSAHLVGFSLGGAVATVTAERDPRARSVANLDGGMYGSRTAHDIRVPYLMMYSSSNDGGNDRLLPGHAQRVAPAGTTHMNYHDVAALLPGLRYLHATGSTNATAFVAQRNLTVREFLSVITNPSRGLSV
jgi:dienelactone hydrolase